MAARRLILAMIVLLVASSVAAALVPVEQGADQSSTETSPPGLPPSGGRLVTKTLRAGAEHPQTIALELGDQLSLTVTSKVPDQVAVPELGELDDVERDAPAHFDLLPFEPGRYPVRLVDAKKAVGWIVVRPKAKRQAGEKSKDSPGSSTTARTPGARSAT